MTLNFALLALGLLFTSSIVGSNTLTILYLGFNSSGIIGKFFKFASILSKNIPFVRVDFYEVNGKLYFGELTFYPSGGFDTTRTKECQEYLDNALIINNRKQELK